MHSSDHILPFPKAAQPVLTPELLEEALRDWAENGPTDEEIGQKVDAIRHERLLSYVHTLHPLLRDDCLHMFLGGYPLCGEDPVDVAKVVNIFFAVYNLKRKHRPNAEKFEEERDAYYAEIIPDLTPGQKRLFEQYRDEDTTVGAALMKTLDYSFRTGHYLSEELLQQARDTFWQKRGSADLQYQAGYELARREYARPPQELFDDSITGSAPFERCGWAAYDQSLIWGMVEGVGFRIEKRCFANRDAELYYFNDDRWPDGNADSMAEFICRCSSGIADVRIEERIVTMHNQRMKRNVIFFRLSSDVKTLILNRDEVNAADLGGHVFVLPRSGEFSCEFGEYLHGKLIPLYHDSFCMK